MANTLYDNYSPRANKIINKDGSITTLTGEIPVNPSQQWLNASPMVNKLLNPDNSIGLLTDTLGASGQGTPGKSAYEYAKEAGYTGTEAEFAVMLNRIGDMQNTIGEISEVLSEILGGIGTGTIVFDLTEADFSSEPPEDGIIVKIK